MRPAIATACLLAAGCIFLSAQLLIGDEPSAAMNQRMLPLRSIRQKLLVEFGPEHPKVKQYDSMIAELEARYSKNDQALDDAGTDKTDLRETVQALVHRVEKLERELSTLNESLKPRIQLLTQ